MEEKKIIFRHNLLQITGTENEIQKYTKDALDMKKQLLEQARTYMIENEPKHPHNFIHHICINAKREYIVYYGEVDTEGQCHIFSQFYHSGDSYVQDSIDINRLSWLNNEDDLLDLKQTIAMTNAKLVGDDVMQDIMQKYHAHHKEMPLFDDKGNNVADNILTAKANTTVLRSNHGFYAGTTNHFIIPEVIKMLKTDKDNVCLNNVTYNDKDYEVITYRDKCVTPADLIDPGIRPSLVISKKIIDKPIIDISVQNGILCIDGKPALTKEATHTHHENEGIIIDSNHETDIPFQKQ